MTRGPAVAGGAQRFFDAIAGRYDRVYGLAADVSRARMQRVLRELPHPCARVLDLGVGTGRELSVLLDAGHSPTGIDVSAEMLQRCARRARPVPLVLADFWQPLPFDDGSFDAALALHGTLAHSPDERAMSRLGLELSRVVRPGGAFVAEVPSTAWLERAPSLPSSEDLALRVTGPRTCVFEDRVAGATVETRVLSEAEWTAALRPGWITRLEPLGELEWLVVATRTS